MCKCTLKTHMHIHKAHIGYLYPHCISKCACLRLYCSISAIIITVLGTKAGIKVFESFVFPNRNISVGLIKLTWQAKGKLTAEIKNYSLVNVGIRFFFFFLNRHLRWYPKYKMFSKQKSGVASEKWPWGVGGEELQGDSACSYTHWGLAGCTMVWQGWILRWGQDFTLWEAPFIANSSPTVANLTSCSCTRTERLHEKHEGMTNVEREESEDWNRES